MSFDEAKSLDALNIAAVGCAKSVCRKANVQDYILHKAQRNERLLEDIERGYYHLQKYHEFIITEPKVRVIDATAFRDRVWQRSMCNNGVRDDLTSSFIYDNGACQKQKGTEFAVLRVIRFLQYTYRVCGGNDFYYVHLDIKGFFPNTPHSELKKITRERIKDERFVPYLDEIIDSCKDRRPPEEVDKDTFGARGTILGSEIGQELQLALLDKIDHHVKERIRVKCYLRYNDDFLMIGADKSQLVTARNYIVSEVAKIGLTVKDKSGLQKVKHGFVFMRKTFIVKPSGKILVLPPKKRITEEKHTLRKMSEKVKRGEIGMDAVERHYQSVVGTLVKCDCEKAIRSLDLYYENVFGQKPNYRRKKNAHYQRSRKSKKISRGKCGAESQSGKGLRESGLCGNDDGCRNPGRGGTRT